MTTVKGLIKGLFLGAGILGTAAAAEAQPRKAVKRGEQQRILTPAQARHPRAGTGRGKRETRPPARGRFTYFHYHRGVPVRGDGCYPPFVRRIVPVPARPGWDRFTAYGGEPEPVQPDQPRKVDFPSDDPDPRRVDPTPRAPEKPTQRLNYEDCIARNQYTLEGGRILDTYFWAIGEDELATYSMGTGGNMRLEVRRDGKTLYKIPVGELGEYATMDAFLSLISHHANMNHNRYLDEVMNFDPLPHNAQGCPRHLIE